MKMSSNISPKNQDLKKLYTALLVISFKSAKNIFVAITFWDLAFILVWKILDFKIPTF